MLESCGGNFPEGNYRGGGFHLIQEYFQQRSCRHCCRNYSPEGIELIREEPGLLVVRVVCSTCGHPLGIALVGINRGAKLEAARSGAGLVQPSGSYMVDRPYPRDWNKSDVKRLSGQERISYDDVLDAHEFFSELGGDWQKHLPKKFQRAGRQDVC